MKELSHSIAKDFILRKQKLTKSTQGNSKQDISNIVRDLAGIQYDPLAIVAQAHYLALWNRIRGFKEEWLDSLIYEEKSLIEFLLMRQALHIVPTSELPYYYNAVQAVFRKGWVQKAINNALRDKEILEILKNIEEKGVISSKGFPYARFRPLFFSGKLAIAKRDEGIFRIPYYCTLERLHPNIDLSSVDEETACEWLVAKTISAFGLASTSHISYWIGLNTKDIETIINQLREEGVVFPTRVEGVKKIQWILAEDVDKLPSQDDHEENAALLSPLDNLTRDRKWMHEMFNYTFEMEYFQKKGMRWQLSILYDSEFVGFINAKMDRPRRTFIIKEIVPHKDIPEKAWNKIFHKIINLANFHNAITIMIATENPEQELSIFHRLGLEPKDRLVDITEQPSE